MSTNNIYCTTLASIRSL